MRPLLPVLLLCLLVPAVARGATIYDPVAEFGTDTNPTGVWGYGRSASITGAFTALPTPSPSPTFPSWLNSPDPYPAYYPLMGRNASDEDLDLNLGGGQLLPNDVLYLHPGEGPEPWVVLRFVAPEDGSFGFAGEFHGVTVSTTDIAVIFDGEVLDVLAGNGQIDGTESQDFAFVLALAGGEAVDFRVGARGDINGDSTLLALEVTLVPEPASALLVGTGLTILASAQRRRRAAR